MLRIFCTVLIAGLAAAGVILGSNMLADSRDETAAPQGPKTATPSPEEEQGYWTPERLKEAKPIEMPHAPGWPPATAEPDTSRPGPSQSGAGSAGSGEVAPEEGTTLIPGLSEPHSGDESAD